MKGVINSWVLRLRKGLILLAGGIFLSGPLLSAQSVYLVCENGYVPPPIDFDLPEYATEIDFNVTILTDAQTRPNVAHDVTVVTGGNNVYSFSFNVGTTGTDVTPNLVTTSNTYGPNSNSSSNTFYSTVIGVYTVGGNNFPLYMWPDVPNYPVSPNAGTYEFQLDESLGWTPTADTDKFYSVTSNYYYNNWGWITFLGFEDPYFTGAGPLPSYSQPVTFDLRGSVKQAPHTPNGCPGDGVASCSGCGQSASASNPAMAGASLDRFHAGIVITDTPVGYSPPVGMPMNFTVSYRQRLNCQPASINFSNLGPLWQYGWISYITGGPTSESNLATQIAPDGSQYDYTGYEQTLFQGLGAPAPNTGDFQDNNAYTHATLHYRQNPERYELWEPDGSVQVFAMGTGASPNREFFLSSIIDPQGNITTINYDPTQAASGNAVITSIVDPQGNKLVFSYESTNPLQITMVTRSLDGHAARFGYTGGQLTSITDPIGITSSFQYLSGTSFISKMTTPYGDTTFNSTDGSGYLEADMTNPLGQTERVEYQENLSTSLYPASDSAIPSATGLTIDNTDLNTASSFYWTRRAMSDAAAGSIATDSEAFYALAYVTHWAEGGQGSIPVPLCAKKPLEGRVWYNYPNQPDADTVLINAPGTSTSPSITARVLDGGGTQASFATYNGNGMITQSVDPIGRTTNYTYASNGIDLTEVSQTNGAGQDILSAMSYNSAHLPLSVADASGQVTNMTYNAQGQLLTRTDALSETTTLAYNGGRYLSSVTGPVSGATTSYTYDSAGRVQTVEDSEGYVLTYAYDNLDRVVSVTYPGTPNLTSTPPDTKTDLTHYHILDVDQTTDRQGRSTYNQYDLIRELVQTTDPLGRTTKYSWCTCGGLSTLTDANNHVTTWGLDEQGRVTSKTYADSTSNTYTYETNTSRLHSMTDARGSTATYSYNVDNTLAGTSYSLGSGVAATPNVSFTYDSVYNRVTSMSDGTGTNTYSYNAVYTSGSPITGGGRLASVSTPIAGSSAAVTYGYDALGRVTTRGIDASTTDANNVSTTFDMLGRVTSTTNSLGSFGYSYVDTTARLAGVTYPSGTGLSTSYSYYGNTGDQRLETIANLISGTNVSTFGYTYNAVGTIATWTQKTDSNPTATNTLSYDNADQLVNSTNTLSGTNIATNVYGYDPAGNRLAETTLTGTTGGQFNSVNQLTAIGGTTNVTIAGYTSASVSAATVNAVPASISEATNFSASVPLPNGTNVISVVAQPTSTNTPITTQRVQTVTNASTPTALTYDANGNCTQDENGNEYTWDALNRLTAIVYTTGANAGNHTEFAYDGLSRRVQIVERDGTTIGSGTVISTKNYLWVGSEIAEERDSSNNVTKRFFPQGEQQSGTPYYYTRDHLTSIREMVDSSGTIVSRMDYDPMGRATVVSGTNLPFYQYAGLVKHTASGLNMATYRFYENGRWLSRDPIGENGGINLYDYVANDFCDLIDTRGLCCDLTLAIGHGHVPTWSEWAGLSSPAPNTNNSYFNKHGNACTMYGGCGSNALNSGGVGDGVYPNNWNGGKHPSAGSLANGQDNSPEDYSLGARAEEMMNALAKKKCKEGGCPKVTVTIVINPGTDSPFFNSLKLPTSGKPLNGYTQSFNCSDPSMK